MLHGCFAFNLVQALDDVYRREIPRGGAPFGKLPFRIEAGFTLSWFEIVVGVRLDVPLVSGTEGQKTEFAGSWMIYLSNESSTLVFTCTWYLQRFKTFLRCEDISFQIKFYSIKHIKRKMKRLHIPYITTLPPILCKLLFNFRPYLSGLSFPTIKKRLRYSPFQLPYSLL